MSTDDEIKENFAETESADQPTTWKTVVASWLAEVFLFCATAALVLWQNSRVTVLYDLSGVIEPAYRMSLGDRPYADFPFPYAPLTFLIQSWIIRIWGTIYWHHIAYVAVVAGLASVLTWWVITNILRNSFRWPRSTAFLLSLPIIILGIYCIFPHPFYDPDATFFMLVSVAAILWLERRGFPLVPTFFAGMLLVVPFFVKQNIGLAYFGSWLVALLVFLVVSAWKKLPFRGYVAIILGSVTALAIAAAMVDRWVGLATYKYWIWDFARLRRTPSAADMLSVYQDPLLVVWLISFATGAVLLWLPTRKRKLAELAEEALSESFSDPAASDIASGGRIWMPALGVALMCVPFFWPVIYLFMDADASERAERLVNVWPVMLIGSVVLCILSFRRVTGVRTLLPFILVATAHGVFLSQQLWGSTYGIWPILPILIALVALSLNELTDRRFNGYLTAFGAIASACLITAGAFYVYSNDRLDYIDLEDGELQHSTLPQLAGLSIRGDYLPDFEELVRYVHENIPPDESIIEIPGEDLFYYTIGRRPEFPVTLFDVTNNPYTPEQIADIARERNIKWLIVKNDLQIDTDKSSGDKTIDDKGQIVEKLLPDYKHIDSLNNYEIYRRRLPGETDNGDEDENDNGDDSDDDSDSN